MQEALAGQRQGEVEREALQGQVQSLERERVSLEQSEQQCAEQAQVLHQQKMELVTRMREEGTALQRAREQQELLTRQLAGEAQRILRLQHRLQEMERQAQLQRREVAEKQREADTLSLLLHNKVLPPPLAPGQVLTDVHCTDTSLLLATLLPFSFPHQLASAELRVA